MPVGLNSPNSIVNYEKGDRIPKPEIMKKIAAHYRIPEDEIVNTDFVDNGGKVIITDNLEKFSNFGLTIFPTFESKKALANSYFKNGYEAHMRIIEGLKNNNDKIYSSFDFDTCFDNYFNACEKNDIPEAMANLLWWFIQVEIFTKNNWVRSAAEKISEKRMKPSEALKSYCLRDMVNDSYEEMDCELSSEDISDIEEYNLELIKKLNKHEGWHDLVDFYIAIRYATGCINNSSSVEMNRTMGYEMLRAFAKINMQ